MVNCESKWDIDNVTQFIREEGYTFPVYYDFDGSADKAYGTGYIPVTVAITKNGEIIYHDSGSLDEGTLKDLVEKVQK